MKIVNRSTFLAMPPGTVYAKYEPCIFEEMCIKGETLFHDDGRPFDWFYQQIVDAVDAFDSNEWSDRLERSRLTGESVPMNFDIESRDGCFEDDQLFAVWEPADITALITRLQEALAFSSKVTD